MLFVNETCCDDDDDDDRQILVDNSQPDSATYRKLLHIKRHNGCEPK